MAEGLLSELDSAKTPTFAMRIISFKKIDKSQNETDYLEALKGIIAISPRHEGAVTTYWIS